MNNEHKIADADRTDKITGIHKLPLIGAGLVVALTIFVVGTAQYNKSTKVDAPITKTLAERDLIFRDGTAGNIVVRDAKTKELLGKFGRGEGAFIRISMRAMTHARRQNRVAQGQPYTLVKGEGNRLTIVDPVTGTSIKLNAFGAVAMDSFAKFLPKEADTKKTSQNSNQQKQKGA